MARLRIAHAWHDKGSRASASASIAGTGHTLCDIILSVRAHHTTPGPLVTSSLPHTVYDEDAEPRSLWRGAVTPGSAASQPQAAGVSLALACGVLDGGRPVAGNGRT